MCFANAVSDFGAGGFREEGTKICVQVGARRAMCAGAERTVKAERKEVARVWREEEDIGVGVGDMVWK